MGTGFSSISCEGAYVTSTTPRQKGNPFLCENFPSFSNKGATVRTLVICQNWPIGPLNT